jgi:hypothetical protein
MEQGNAGHVPAIFIKSRARISGIDHADDAVTSRLRAAVFFSSPPVGEDAQKGQGRGARA